MNQLNTFVAPKPNLALIRSMDWVNRVVMLKGVVGLRDLPLVNRLAGLRGVANVRCLDFPAADQERLRRASLPGKACFVTPNHPEFFTDSMIDKEIASRFFPKAAFWATNTIVNGLGRFAQKFWLANNLIAQIPGNSAPAREHSINYALDGNTVLLHPEGQVGWHRNHVADLMPGAAEMALEVVRRNRRRGDSRDVWLVPVVWKLEFLDDVTPALARECTYVERKLGIEPATDTDLARRVFAIYVALLERDEVALGIISAPDEPFARRHARRIETLGALLAKGVNCDPALDIDDIFRAARKRLRSADQSGSSAALVKKYTDMLQKAKRIGAFAWVRPTIRQEEIAEHIKRLRADHCFGSWRDTLNRFVPQPAGQRVAHVRVPEPMAMHTFDGSADEVAGEMRRRMQAALDGVVEARNSRLVWRNPFAG